MRGLAAPKHTGSDSTSQAEPAASERALVEAWWAAVLAGDVYAPHPTHGSLKVNLRGLRLRLAGELETELDRAELVRQARQRIGHGINRVDVSKLSVSRGREKAGVLEQTLFSAFPSREAAEFARTFVANHSRTKPRALEIVDPSSAGRLRSLLPEDFRAEAQKALDAGHALLVATVDETAAFRVRELLEERTRSVWTVAAPPRLPRGSG